MQLGTPDALGIQDVAALRQRWLADLAAAPADAAELVVDVAALGDVDGAGLQLLVSLARSAERRGARLRLAGVRDGLRATLDGLHSGLFAHLEA